jgi:hypothetical protein
MPNFAFEADAAIRRAVSCCVRGPAPFKLALERKTGGIVNKEQIVGLAVRLRGTHPTITFSETC